MNKETIFKYLNGKLDQEELESLTKWMNESEANRKKLINIKNKWTKLKSITEIDTPLNFDNEFELIKLKIDQRNSNTLELKYKVLFRYTAVAAVFLLLISIAGFLYFTNISKQSDYNQIITKKGEKSKLILADGTQIWINSESKLKYPSNLNSNEANLYLEGEAFFDVKRNENRSFVVNTSTINIKVLGTRFNVKSYSEENIIETTLEKGEISITGKVGNKSIKRPVILKPNQQAKVFYEQQNITVSDLSADTTESSVQKVRRKNTTKIKQIPKSELKINTQVNAELYSSWKDGKLMFTSESFESLSRRMERWYNIEIINNYEELKDKKCTGVFEKETLEQAVEALSLLMHFDYHIEKNKVIITGKK